MKKLIGLFVFLLFVGSQIVTAQSKQITGTVTSADDGLGMPGVSVVVKGTTIGASTDIDGKYSLEADANDVFVFSFVGMVQQEITVGNQTVINVVMETESIGMDEVVVTALGITRSKKSLGYAVSDIKADEAINNSEPDVLRALQGKVPGVNISSSGGDPGGATRITIRGNSSFLGNNQPLFVVDGIPYSNDAVNTSNQSSGGGAYGSGLSTLDPNDIQSMSVLKGAAAAALYGSRAANGVVIVTTKSGSATATRKGLEISVSQTVTFEQIANLPDYQNKYGNGTNFNYANANGSWGPEFATLDSIPAWTPYVEAFPELFPNGKDSKVAYEAQPDNVKDLFDTGVMSETSLNINGGNEKSSFSTTMTYMDHKGFIPHSGFERMNFSVGGKTQLDNGLIVNGNLSYSKTDQKGSIYGNNQTSGASSSFARTLWLGRTWDMSLPYTNPVTGGPVSTSPSQYDHPLWAFKNNTVNTTMTRTVGQANFSYAINDFFNVSYSMGVNRFSQQRREIVDLNSRGAEGLGEMKEDYYSKDEYESNLMISFEKDFDDISLKAMVGHNVNIRETDRNQYTGSKFKVRGIDNLFNAKEHSAYDYNGITDKRLWALFGEVTVGYKNFLFATATLRNDWSSTLPKSNNNYMYPSFATSLIVSDLLEIDKNILSLAKIRASWARVGNDTSPYQTNGFYQLGSPVKNMTTLRSFETFYDENLKNETTDEIELGFNVNLFNNRVNLDMAVYKRNSYDQIAPVSLPTSTGFRSFVTNFGEMENKGIEIGVNLVPVKTKDFTWNIDWTFSKNKSEVLELIDGVDRIFIGSVFSDIQPALEVGKPYGFLYGTKSKRDDAGNLLIDPANGQLISDTELGEIGDPNPDYKTGLINNFSYKGISLNVVFDYTHGGDIYSNSIASMLGRGVLKDTEDREGAWIIPGVYGDPNTGVALVDNAGNSIPNDVRVSTNELYFGNSFGINAQSEWNVYDASVFRLREVSFGYELPKEWLNRTPFGKISLSFVGRNLWYHAPNVPDSSNYDPEINGYGASNVQGIEFSTSPSAKRYGFNVKFTF